MFLFTFKSECFHGIKKTGCCSSGTAEAGYVAANIWVNQAVWIIKLLIAISKKSVFHGKTKHFNINVYYPRKEQNNVEIMLVLQNK